MKTVNNSYSTLQKNVNKWQRKYATGEIEWEMAALAIRTLIVQYQGVQTIRSLQEAIKQEHKENRRFWPYGIAESLSLEERGGEEIL